MEANLHSWVEGVCVKYSMTSGAMFSKEDLMQEAWVVWLETNRKFDRSKGSLIHFFRRNLRNRLVDIVRREKRSYRSGGETLSDGMTNAKEAELFGFDSDIPSEVAAKELFTWFLCRLDPIEVDCLRGRMFGLTTYETAMKYGHKYTDMSEAKLSIVSKFKCFISELP